jgi:hypothetical protein
MNGHRAAPEGGGEGGGARGEGGGARGARRERRGRQREGRAEVDRLVEEERTRYRQRRGW